jgi:hypothetical protein
MRSPAVRRVMRTVSLVSMVAGLVSTGVGAVGALRSHGPAAQAAAVFTPAPPATASEAAPSPSPTAAATSPTCANDVFGYSLRYPSTWIVSSATPEQGCGYFDTSAIARAALLHASRTGGLAKAAIRIYPYGGSYQHAVLDIHNRSGVDAGNTIDMAVGNTSGERIDAIVRPAGGLRTHLFLYLFDLRGKAFVADAYQPYSADFAQTMHVLDRMMRTLRLQ